MSTSSLPRRVGKPSATSDAAAKTTKPLTPSLQKSSSGKENPPRATSRPRASSVTRTKAIPRIDKPSGRVEARGGPRGRSASPSQFSRVLSDLRKGVSRVEIDRKSVEKSVDRRISEKGVLIERKNVEKLGVDRRISEKGVSIVEKLSVDGRFSEKGVSVDRKNVEKLSVDGRFGEKGVSVDRKNVEKLSVDGRFSEKGRRGKNGGFVGDLKSVEDNKFGSRGVRNKDGNSVCSSSIGMRLNDGIGSGDKGRVLEGLKFKKCVEKGVGLLGMKESRLNGDVDLGVSDSIELKSGGESSLDGNVEMSEVSGGVKETEMRLSVQDIGESLGLNDLTGNRKVDLSEKDHVIEEVQVRASGEKSDKLISKGLRLVGRASVSSGALKDKAVIEEGKGNTLSAKRYPSKLHEKLAFLEGKVKKIASDIKQTKEMLDLNNPDASKVILSDIQEKISGIEKAMGNVVGVGNANVKLLKDDDNDEGKVQESIEQEGQIGDGKRSVKGLSVHELEARLFPHHKLLKDRTCLKPSSEISQLDESREVESIQNQKSRDKARSSIDENPVAMEFLEALKNGHPVEDKNEDTENSEDAAPENNSASLIACQNNFDFSLTANENLDEFGEQEHTSRMVIDEENEKSCAYMLKEIGHKISTGGWFVSEGEAVLLSHDDGSCSYYDITNCEGKAEYKPPVGTSPNMWRDCWIVRAPSSDGCSGRYVVAASAGNSFEAGFCSWDFYTKDVRAFHSEDGTAYVRTALADLPNNTMHRRNALSSTSSPDHQQWFYRPCGPLIVSTASCQRSVKVYDIRDGEHVMRWELQKPVATMEYSSPLQWRNRGKVVVAEADTISLWDVSSLSPQPLLSVSSCNRKISALHVNNTDAELGGGVRQRVSSSEVEGNDGVFCTADSINVLDFRQPSGIGLKIPKVGGDVQSAFSCGDSVLLGCTSLKSAGKKQFSSQIQQFSLRKQRLVSTYVLPDSNAHAHHKAITQVWGNSNLVMGVCGLGLCIYDSSKDEGLLPYTTDTVQMNNAKDVIGPNDLYFPSFDYLASRVLLISRDRPALWRYVS